MVASDQHTDALRRVSAAVPDRDDSTRYLCAAAHLSPDYADAVVAEMLVEPTRATAPSPGIDPGAVLTEAVIARVRVRLVAVAVLLAAVLLAVLWPGLLAVWVLLAWLVLLPRLARQLKSKRGLFMANVVFIAVALAAASAFDLEEEVESLDALALLPVLVVLAVFVANRVAVNRLIATRFQRRRGHQPSPSARLDSQLLSLSPELAERVKERYLAADVFVAPGEVARDWVPVVVHRGYEPFVGAGPTHRPWSMAIPLERDPHAEEHGTLSTARLLEAIGREVEALRGSGTLSPSGRFRRLLSEDVVVIGSDELVEHFGEEQGRPFIADENHRPHTHITRARALALRDEPVEWARYYRRFTVLTWDHDLIVSVYLHVAMDDSTLYVEWTPCVLRPISEFFRGIDTEHHTVGRAVRQALGDLVRFPAELPAAVVRLCSVPRPLKVEDGMVNPDKYGALHSLREFAADDGVRNYFQRLDVDRYLKIMHTRAIRAISALLRDTGYLRASLEQQAQAIVQNSVHIGGSMTGPITMGLHNTIGGISVNETNAKGS